MQHSLSQFMEGDTILVINHIFNRQHSFRTGVMSCRSVVDGISLGERLSTMTIQDLERIADGKGDPSTFDKCLLKAISTSCRAMGHTTEAAMHARRRNFAMMDYLGLNSLFASTTPNDLDSFRVRLYSKAQEWVSLVSI